ncbi:unnamed protein product [Schistosoma intercalatum]|nr:unnamed protein product [Schistosoma intercalatum]CAH8547621.1 unnamed protein product [Schistosoma intercalatum]
MNSNSRGSHSHVFQNPCIIKLPKDKGCKRKARSGLKVSHFFQHNKHDIMKKKRSVATELVQRASSILPAFTDIFDEETFYIFFICLVIFSFIIAFSIAKYFDITINDADHLKLTKRQKLKRHYSMNQQK